MLFFLLIWYHIVLDSFLEKGFCLGHRRFFALIFWSWRRWSSGKACESDCKAKHLPFQVASCRSSLCHLPGWFLYLLWPSFWPWTEGKSFSWRCSRARWSHVAKFSLNQDFGVDYMLVSGVSLGSSTFGEVIESILRIDHLREFQSRAQCFFYISVVRTVKANSVKDLLVT